MTNEELIAHQKAVADKVLSLLEVLDKHAIVAGGAPRDWFMGKPATDVDVMVYVPPTVNFKEMFQLMGLVIDEYMSGEDIPEWYKKNENIHTVANCIVDDVKVQIVVRRTTTYDALKEFPLSICKIWYKFSKIFPEDDFLWSVRYDVIYKTSDGYGRQDMYLQKIFKKFPDFHYYESKLAFLDQHLYEVLGVKAERNFQCYGSNNSHIRYDSVETPWKLAGSATRTIGYYLENCERSRG